MDATPEEPRRLEYAGEPDWAEAGRVFLSQGPPAYGTTERGVPFIARPCSPETMVAAVRYVLRNH